MLGATSLLPIPFQDMHQDLFSYGLHIVVIRVQVIKYHCKHGALCDLLLVEPPN